VRPDGASGRVRWQHWKIQEPEGQAMRGGFFWLLFLAVEKE